MEKEEALYYPFGRLVDEIYRKLWELDTPANWEKVADER